MDESKATPRAVVLSAILHIGIVGFLFLAILPCSSYEQFFNSLGLPASMNPITCSRPLQLQGPIIEATLIGPTGSPPPKAVKARPVPHSTPPPPTVAPPPIPPAPIKLPVKTLPPPPIHPDVVDQERVVADAMQQAEHAKKLQEEKQRQRQSELDAAAAKRKAEKQKQLDALFAKMDAAAAQTKKLDSKARQARQQMEDLKNAQDDGQPNLPVAKQRQSGNNSPDSSLADEYTAAIQNAVTPNWLRPDNMPNLPCEVHIVQSPGGDVLSATVDSSCPYDDAGRRSVENAVLRTRTLPYKGFESVFQRHLTFTFRPQ
ncbi:MAG: cell envelope integrity protein TolA [Rhodanobacter sp.]|nr:MAG: cell envelope integrity protein TolA [Rhodanobacter sp.]